MKNYKLIIAISILVIAALIFFNQFFNSKTNQIRETNVSVNTPRKVVVTSSIQATVVPTKAKEEMVTIDFGGGEKVEGKTVAGNALEALKKLTAVNDLSLETKQYTLGAMVTKIGSKENSKTKGWVYSVNGKSGQIAPDRLVTYPEDKILWEYKDF